MIMERYLNSIEIIIKTIFKFLENTRLYRLVTYLSYYKEPILKCDLSKNEFADNTRISGYQYMTYIDGD